MTGVAAAVRELAMRPVHPPPGLDQLEDRLLLPVQDAVHRAAARITALQRAGIPQPRSPEVRADV